MGRVLGWWVWFGVCGGGGVGGGGGGGGGDEDNPSLLKISIQVSCLFISSQPDH